MLVFLLYQAKLLLYMAAACIPMSGQPLVLCVHLPGYDLVALSGHVIDVLVIRFETDMRNGVAHIPVLASMLRFPRTGQRHGSFSLPCQPHRSHEKLTLAWRNGCPPSGTNAKAAQTHARPKPLHPCRVFLSAIQLVI